MKFEKDPSDITKVDFDFKDIPENQACWALRIIPYCFFMEVHMPQSIMDPLNEYLDDLDRVTYEYSLIGAIKRGKQLVIDPNHEKVKPWARALLECSQNYLKQYEVSTGNKIGVKDDPRVNSFWSVHSYEGDYNPCHDHGTIDVAGLSFAGWARVPKTIDESEGEASGITSGTQDSHDGYFQFLTCSPSQRDMISFKPQTNPLFKPKVGQFLIFPAWLNHTVYPFFGPGERRSIAGNISFEAYKGDEANKWFADTYPEMHEIRNKGRKKEEESGLGMSVKPNFIESEV